VKNTFLLCLVLVAFSAEAHLLTVDKGEAVQRLANEGHVVIAVCRNPDQAKPGHVALVMPEESSSEKLGKSGPELIMAGTHNHNKVSLKAGFHSHLTEWPEHVILFYYNTRAPEFN
jgi:hypothetical protein